MQNNPITIGGDGARLSRKVGHSKRGPGQREALTLQYQTIDIAPETLLRPGYGAPNWVKSSAWRVRNFFELSGP